MRVASSPRSPPCHPQGKTSLVDRYINGKFVGSHKSTIGAEFNPIDVQVDDVSVSVQVWDTAVSVPGSPLRQNPVCFPVTPSVPLRAQGQERFASLGNAFYRGADSCVLVYDVTNASSFARIWSDWRRKFIERAGAWARGEGEGGKLACECVLARWRCLVVCAAPPRVWIRECVYVRSVC